MTTASVDAVNMYPLIKIVTIRKEIRFFTRGLTTSTKKNQSMLGAHPIWDEIHIDLLLQELL